MNCPSCDLQTLPDQRFCRSCGANLQMTTQRLAEPAAVSELKRPPVITVKADPQRLNRPVPWGFVVMFIGVAIGLIGKNLVHEEIVTIVGVLVTLAGMFLTAYPYTSPARAQKQESGTATPPDVLAQSPATKYLPQDGHIESLPSITERTTDLLMNPAPTRTRQKEDEES